MRLKAYHGQSVMVALEQSLCNAIHIHHLEAFSLAFLPGLNWLDHLKLCRRVWFAPSTFCSHCRPKSAGAEAQAQAQVMATLTRKWVHQGNTLSGSVAYSSDGSLLYTAGGEDFIRVFSGEPKNNDAESLALIEYHEAPVLSLDCSVSSSGYCLPVWPDYADGICCHDFRWKVS